MTLPVVLTPAAHVTVAVARTDELAVSGGGEITARESRAARRLLRRILPAAAACEPIASRPSGQPYVVGFPDVGVSLSHGHGFVAAAVALGRPVGVDVQAPVSVSDRVLSRCCAPAVRDALVALPALARELEFAWIWTVQEACVKAAGTGLAGRPWAIPVGYRQHAGSWQAYRWRSLRDATPVPVSVAFGSPR